jgi:phosphoribosyl-AMP cyclohydrolase / phosphoribosyl-ATP pyrophosphohydrolase
MDRKNLFATLYLKNGEAVFSPEDHQIIGSAQEIVKLYNDSGIDKIILFDLSEQKDEHILNIHKIKELIRMIEVPVYGTGNLHQVEDIRNLLFAGCQKVILDSSQPDFNQLLEDSYKRFGKDKLTASLKKVDALFKQRINLETKIEELFIYDETIIDAVENLTMMPFIPIIASNQIDDYIKFLKMPNVTGIGGPLTDATATDIMLMKNQINEQHIQINHLETSVLWEDFQLDTDGLMPVITQDYISSEVINFGYMNQYAFEQSIKFGRMTYYNKESGELSMFGFEEAQYQYIKSFTLDCHRQTLLAKISQFGNNCFPEEILKKDFLEKNTIKVFENLYDKMMEQRIKPIESSYISHLVSKGEDEVLKKCGEMIVDLMIAAKNGNSEAIRSDLTDLIYHLMVLMTEHDLKWQDVTNELIQR